MSYKLSPKDGHAIDPLDARTWMDRYKKKHADGIHAYFFGSDIIRQIIDHPEAVGMRIYFAYKNESDKHQQIVLIGSREDGTNIWPIADAAAATTLSAQGGSVPVVADGGTACPPYC